MDDLAFLLSLIDFTNLNLHETKSSIEDFCLRALALPHPVAAICLYPQYVSLAKKHLAGSSIKVATVANFPQGTGSFFVVQAELLQSIADGADEIDIVFPYAVYQSGQQAEAFAFIDTCINVCKNKVIIKVILETGALTIEEISKISQVLVTKPIQFLKTSTGKIAIGATTPAVEAMLKVLPLSMGIKISGGVRDKPTMLAYLELIEQAFGPAWIHSQHVRFGASGLVDALLQTDDKKPG